MGINMNVNCVKTMEKEEEIKQISTNEVITSIEAENKSESVEIEEDSRDIQLIFQILSDMQQQNKTFCIMTGKLPKHLDETIKRYANKTMYKEILSLRELVVKYERLDLRNKLTDTERCILKAIYDGFTQKQIAESSFVTLSTIKNHVTNILKKTGAGTSKDAAKIVKALDLI